MCVCGHILCLCISAQVEVVPTSSLVQKERATKCVGNAGWTVVVVQAFWYRWYVKSKQLLWFYAACVPGCLSGTGHIYLYISPIRKGCVLCLCLCGAVWWAAAGTLHIQSIYEWLCALMFPAHQHLYACILTHQLGTSRFSETVQEHCCYHLVLVGYST